MKKILAITSLSLVSSLISLPALATSNLEGWYVSGSAGATYTPDMSINFENSIVTDVTYQQPGWDAGAAVGYQYKNWRLEAAFTYMSTNMQSQQLTLDDFTLPRENVNGSTNVSNLMFNSYYDFHLGSAFVPYLGAGLGGSHINNHFPKTEDQDESDGDDNLLALQAIAGLAYQITPKTRVYAEYRLFASAVNPTGALFFDNTTYTNNLFNLGVSYVFAS